MDGIVDSLVSRCPEPLGGIVHVGLAGAVIQNGRPSGVYGLLGKPEDYNPGQ
ncbi:MAG: hypothetical protein ACJ74Z_14290 [Bryobacteraceae bacterium]